MINTQVQAWPPANKPPIEPYHKQPEGSLIVNLGGYNTDALASHIDITSPIVNKNSSSHQWIIRPHDLAFIDTTTGNQPLAGATIVIDVANSALLETKHNLIVYPVIQHPYVQLSYSVMKHDDGSGSIRIFLLNPSGFTSDSIQSSYQQAHIKHLQLALLYTITDDLTNTNMKLAFEINQRKSYYIDLHGNPIAGLEAELVYDDNL